MAERKTRIGGKIRAALTYMVEEGLSRKDAAEKAGLRDNSLYKALRRTDVCSLRSEIMRVFRESAASRTIAHAERLMVSAVSEHVQLGAIEYLNPPVARGEITHRHEGMLPGLIIQLIAGPREGALIDVTPRRAEYEDLPVPVPHPAMLGKGKAG